MAKRLAWLLLLTTPILPQASGQVVNGTIDRIGYPTSGAGSVIRDGQWFPILVTLQMQGSGLFAGSVRVAMSDLDGDRVAYMEDPVVINAEAGPKRIWLYAVSVSGKVPDSVDILDENGALVRRITGAPFAEVIGSDAQLILDISSRQIPMLSALQTAGANSLNEMFAANQPFYRNVGVSRMPASELPDRWIGLEPVSVVVWDRPNPQSIDPTQLEALVDWVRRGGQLVIGLSEGTAALRESPLADILGVTVTGSAVQTRALPMFQQRYVPENLRQEQLTDPLAIASVAPTSDALVLFRDKLVPSGKTVDLITSRLVGSGRVITVAASIRDLALQKPRPEILGLLFDLNPRTKKFNENEQRLSMSPLQGAGEVELFHTITTPTNFSAERGLFQAAAFLFVILYIGIATFATWLWLLRRKLATWSWTVFGAFAVTASILSLATVGLTRTFSRGVGSAAMVDLAADSSGCVVHAWFGYGSPIRQRVGLSLGDAGFLRPMGVGPGQTDKYAAPERYVADPAEGVLRNVPMRATVKQFEGVWAGDIEGTIRGQLIADRATGKLSNQSWLRNDLNVPIEYGYLLYLDPRSRAGVFGQLDRAAGVTEHWRLDDPVPPGWNVLAVRLPALEPAERTVTPLGVDEYTAIGQALRDWLRMRQPKEIQRPDLNTLWRMQLYWADQLAAPRGNHPRDSFGARMMLASTRNFFLHNKNEVEFDEAGTRRITTQGLPELDVTHWLQRGQAVLLLFSRTPGPIDLQNDGVAMEARTGVTLYRVRIPITFTGNPVPPPPTPSEDPS